MTIFDAPEAPMSRWVSSGYWRRGTLPDGCVARLFLVVLNEETG